MKWAMIRRTRGFPPSKMSLENALRKPSPAFFQTATSPFIWRGYSFELARFGGRGLVAGDLFTLGVVVEVPKNAVRAFSNESWVIAFAGFISTS
jgi:hypothetical protein